MAEEKTQSDLDVVGEVDDLDLGQTDLSNDLLELKNRMDKTDQEMRAMTQAMKSTLLDVRALMQDMDNPFKMLRDMGVDKLVDKAVEVVEDEVNKQKREEAKKRMAGAEENVKPVAVQVSGQQGLSMRDEGLESLSPEADGGAPKRDASPPVSPPSGVGVVEEPRGEVVARGSTSVPPQIEQWMAQTEASLKRLSDALAKVTHGLEEAVSRSSRAEPAWGGRELGGSDYYEAYVNLVADYLRLRLGVKGAESVLLEGMYREWASPKVVRDIMEKMTAINKFSSRGLASLDLGNGVEDRLLFTALLRNLDKPISTWGESTILFLLLALVSRARENQARKG